MNIHRPAFLRAPLIHAFTLLEVLLTIAVMALLVGVVAFALEDPAAEYLDEGAMRLETALRMTRAEAARNGCTFRMQFTPEGQVIVEWESQPLIAPGVFAPFVEAGWVKSLPNHMVRVVRCQSAEDEAYRPPSRTEAYSNTSPEAASLSPINFRPDGSSDSVQLDLVALSGGDSRVAVISMDGINGLFTTAFFTPDELARARAEETADSGMKVGAAQ